MTDDRELRLEAAAQLFNAAAQELDKAAALARLTSLVSDTASH